MFSGLARGDKVETRSVLSTQQSSQPPVAKCIKYTTLVSRKYFLKILMSHSGFLFLLKLGKYLKSNISLEKLKNYSCIVCIIHCSFKNCGNF